MVAFAAIEQVDNLVIRLDGGDAARAAASTAISLGGDAGQRVRRAEHFRPERGQWSPRLRKWSPGGLACATAKSEDRPSFKGRHVPRYKTLVITAA